MTLSEDDRTEFHDAHPPLSQEIADIGDQPELPAHRIPRLLNWTVLLRPWTPPKSTKGGVLLPDQVAEANDYLTYIAQVVAMGPLAFRHPRLRGGDRQVYRGRQVDSAGNERTFERIEHDFADGQEPPKVGDWVMFRKHSGQRFEINEVQLRMCSDDDILAVLDSPVGWRAYV